jgi:hypothetical protein
MWRGESPFVYLHKIKVMNLGRNGFTPRVQVNFNLKKMIGRVLKCNIFPTLLGRLLYMHDDKCYFEILPNEKWPKYNSAAGKVEYLPEHMVSTMKFQEES